MRSRQEIKAYAKQAFAAQRGSCILGLFLVLLLTSGLSVLISLPSTMISISSITGTPILADLPSLAAMSVILGWISLPLMLLTFVLNVNLCGFFVKVIYGHPVTVAEPYSALKFGFGRKLGGMCWQALWMFLWALVGMLSFYIPTIIKSLAYSMTPYILANNPKISATNALKLSMRMTKGHKGKIFVLGLSFIGWHMLDLLTCGILGIVYVGPYLNTTYAGFFIELRNLAVAKGVIHPAELEGAPPQNARSHYHQMPGYPYAPPPHMQPPHESSHPGMPPYMQPPHGAPHPGMPPYMQPPYGAPHPGMPPYMQPPHGAPHPGMPPYMQHPQGSPYPGMPPYMQYPEGHPYPGIPPYMQHPQGPPPRPPKKPTDQEESRQPLPETPELPESPPIPEPERQTLQVPAESPPDSSEPPPESTEPPPEPPPEPTELPPEQPLEPPEPISISDEDKSEN